MAGKVTPFSERRRRKIVAVSTAGTAVLATTCLYATSLSNLSPVSGWALLVLLLLLALYGLRKKLRRHALAANSTWLQWHLCIGYLAVLVFLVHTGLDLPNGRLDVVLWSFVTGLLLSGLLGIAASRWLPSRLGPDSERVVFERVPAVRAQIRAEVESLAMEAVRHSRSPVVSDVYLNTLAPFLGSSEVMPHLFRLRGGQRRRLAALREIRRYLDGKGREFADEIEKRVVAKYQLDRQYALQLVLKGWLFVHVPLAYAVVPLVILHIIAAYAFSGAMS